MSRQMDSNFLIDSSSPRLFQHLLGSIVSYQQLGSRIIKQIKMAHAFRHVEAVRGLSRVLMNLPIREFRLIGQYYLVWCQCREQKLDTNSLDYIIENTHTYKSRALISKAGFEGLQGNIEPMFYFYAEAMKASEDVSDYVETIRCVAALKSQEGFHKSALKDLEGVLPLTRHVDTLIYYDFLNSYAVELGEAGHREEARNVSRVVLASPFAFAYPEWQETAENLRPPDRPYVAINSSRRAPQAAPPDNVLPMPMREPGQRAARQVGTARVLDLQMWKKKMGKGGDGERPNGELKIQEMLMRIMQVYVSNNTTYEQRRKIYEYALKVLSEPSKPDKPDKHDDDKSWA
jgi:hypothetical protein